MSDTYYAYRDVKVKIAHRLFKMDGWTVYGYSGDNSDPMTDYYDPAYWGGIATKNGYTLVVDRSDAAEETTRTYTVYTDDAQPAEISAKIAKLERMTQANGASAQEEETARAAIAKLKEKKSKGTTTRTDYTPGHMANPPRCNWHIEKDGIIIDKGTGLLKFASVADISGYGYGWEVEQWQKFNNLSREEWEKDYTSRARWGSYPTEDEARRAYDNAAEDYALLERFNELIARWNNTCGGLVGNASGDGFTYEKRTVTKYKKVWKFQPTESGSFKAGQCFRLKANFNYGCTRGTVYRFESAFNGEVVRGQRVSMKSGKSLTGSANSANSFGYYAADDATENHGRDKDRFLKWVSDGSIEWGEVVEVSEPFEVEKFVKVKANGEEYKPKKTTPTEEATEETPANIDYIITPDTDTRNGSALWVVTLSARVDREQFETIREEIKKKGGYYSRFKKGFIFRFDPFKVLNVPQEETPEEPAPEEPAPEEPKKAAPGYTGETSEEFTPAEIETLINGGQVVKGDGWKKSGFFATNYKDGVKFIYSVHIGDADAIHPQTNANFNGFIYSGKYYTDFNAITIEAADDINAAIIDALPTEEAAEKNAVNLDDYQTKNIEFIKNSCSFEKDAMRHFIEETAPELILYNNHDGLNAAEIIRYIVNPGEMVSDHAAEYKKTHRAEILTRYIEYNRTSAALNNIKADKTSPAHILKRIKEATANESEKSYKITLANGATVKADADAVRRMAYSGFISSFYIASTDRQYLNKDERGRAEDITPTEIVNISHGAKILYRAAS